jgi:signal peptidase complex subunit 3
MTADLRSVFSWNTKQVHAFVTVNFASPRNPVNSMVMWSATVERREHGLLVVPHLRAGYPYSITDQGHELLGREFEVTVAWNVMPRVGRLYTGRRSFSGFRLPEEYIKAEKGNIRRSGGRTGADKEAAEAAVRQIAGS